MTAAARSQIAGTRRSGGTADRLFRGITRIFAWTIVALLILLAIQLAASSREAFERFGLGFVISTDWDAVRDLYGALPFIVGTILSALIALTIAAPIGLMTAIFLAELAPRRLAAPLIFAIELLAAIPSVVYGLWGVFVLSPFLQTTVEAWVTETFGWVPFLAGPTFGIGLFAAGVILAIMILPTIVSISREVIGSIPNHQREAMYALGATQWETVTRAILPSARSGIVGALILGLGRALGETMAVTMVIGNAQALPKTLFDPAQTIASQIATTFNEAHVGLNTSSLIALGLVLLVITVAMNIVARLLVSRTATGGGAR